MKKISLRISKLRHKKKITQQELADVVGASFQIISKWENSGVMPYITYLPIHAEYYQQVQDALAGTVTGDSAEGSKDISVGKVVKGEKRSIREALAEKGRTKRTAGAEDRKREEQLSVSEQQAKRNRGRAR